MIVDYVDSDATGPNAPILDMRYLHGPGPDMILAQEDSAGTVLWLLLDHLGTTRDIVDHAGAVADHIAYDSFGNVISQTAPSLLTRYLYTGREYEIETGLYYYRARFYDPTLGKFIQRDPIGFADGTNRYEYVGSSPIHFIDWNGLYCTKWVDVPRAQEQWRKIGEFFTVNQPVTVPLPNPTLAPLDLAQTIANELGLSPEAKINKPMNFMKQFEKSQVILDQYAKPPRFYPCKCEWEGWILKERTCCGIIFNREGKREEELRKTGNRKTTIGIIRVTGDSPFGTPHCQCPPPA